MMKNSKSKVCIAVGTIFIASAVGLSIYNNIEDRNAGKRSESVLPLLAEEASASEFNNIPIYQIYADEDMPALEIDGIKYIGILEIPKLDIELPIINDLDYAELKNAPCRYSGSVYSDNIVIAGHNYKSHFGRLKELQTGDSVIFTDADGNRFTYAVKTSEELAADAVDEMLDETGWDLTLFTCTTDGSMRKTVRCVKDME